MTTAISKRNQARNEKALQDLIRTVPGNERCADCNARNPGWASWSLGIFLCMRCAAIHRKLGTHISKVKSLSMDSWTNDQVENMQKVGNVNSNKIWNPHNRQPNVPVDVDEVDGAIERFIRQKYEQQAFRGGSASTAAPKSQSRSSSNNEPVGASWSPQRPTHSRDSRDSRGSRDPSPQPPAKSGKRFFGLRSATSTFQLGKPKGRERKASLPTGRVVGATIGIKEDELGWKLVTLKEMGFRDEKRNTEILKGLNGDLERTVESLVRLGQGPSDDVALKKQISRNFDRESPRFPQPPERSSSRPAPQSAGITGATLTQSPQVTGMAGIQSSASSPGHRKQSNNPFDLAGQQNQQSAFEQAFSNMSIAPAAPLSSQSTGILPSQQMVAQQNWMQQSMTPPPTGAIYSNSFSNMYLQQANSGGYDGFQNPGSFQQMQPQTTGNNPFMQNQNLYQSAYSSSPAQGYQSPNPFLQGQHQQQQQQQQQTQPFMAQSNIGIYNGHQAQQNQFAPSQDFGQSADVFGGGGYMTQQAQAMAQPQAQVLSPNNPFQQQMMAQMQQQPMQQQFVSQQQIPQQQQQQQFFQQQQQFQQAQMQQPLGVQPTGRLNKQSIMALYGQSMTPQPSIPEDQVASPGSNPASPPPQQSGQPNQIAGNVAANRQSATMPASMSTGSNNPFGAPAGAAAAAAQGQPGAGRGPARDSIFMDGASDPFASLSARFV